MEDTQCATREQRYTTKQIQESNSWKKKRENFNKRDRTHKKNQIKILELKNKINEMKTAIATRRLHQAGNRISVLEDTASKLSKRRKK